jgi:hypothetical protein
MDLTPEQLRTFQIFFPYAFRKHAEIRQQDGRLVHYTSAEAAVSMVRNKEVWMRNSTAVNDFMEIEHGLNCLTRAYNSDVGNRFKQILNGMFPGFCDDLEHRFNGWIPHFRTDTYITCVSEHLRDEDRIGRLSMWRAYGGTTGVAIVLKHGPFLSPSNALKAYSSPVAYLNQDQFAQEFGTVLEALQSNHDFVRDRGKDAIMNSVFSMMRFAVLCTKHPGFHEEREWRVIYSPRFERSERLVADIQIIHGAPQRIFKIPLKDFPEEGFVGAEIPSFVERVIIGPTQYPVAIRDAIVGLLDEAGVENAEGKVWTSDIPLRQ